MNNLQKLEEILKKCIDMGWRYVDVIEGKLDDQHMISYNDIFSVESGLLQFVKWKDSKTDYQKYIQLRHDYKTSTDYQPKDRQYHCMMMSILPVDQKIIYFLENIDNEHN